MKRCPECLFIYPDTDERCDFDKTPLVAVADSVIDAAAKPRRPPFKLVAIAAALVIALGTLVVYLVTNTDKEQDSPNIPIVAVAPVVPEPPLPAPSPSPSPSPSPTATPKPASTRVATSHTTTSLDPVSTSGPARNGGKTVILLTGGGKIDADEVWRTRDGIWYR
ncbi:MAG TPA: hypothetical protein VHH35_05175, partial [Pyrinomonadaceae bacterium]|nr:hypothetical protein [Pyrinomonadaceae bacterium]